MYNQNKILRVLQLIRTLKSPPAKSIRQLSTLLDSTERTVYRYLDLLTEIGFDIQKSERNQICIRCNDENGDLSLNEEEIALMKSLLMTVAKNHPLKDSILKKIYINSETQLHAQQILKAHLGKIIEKLSTAIQTKKQVVLKKYHSFNSNKISDRLVEPIKFTDDYQSVAAYEVKTGKNKVFNIDRISGVEIKKTSFKNAVKHKYKTPDAFGFIAANKVYEIELLLSLRTAMLLKEEYPMTAGLIKLDTKKKLYHFKATVNDLKPITRFVTGFLEDIKIIGSEEFKNHVQEQLWKLLRR
ncbi:MAG: WYL domain-containing protein [Ferruginibacter sp.]|nr:WYL domain-containing protein [Ferruginibacter sp.]